MSSVKTRIGSGRRSIISIVMSGRRAHRAGPQFRYPRMRCGVRTMGYVMDR
jgi:hypothetical protein